MNRVTKSDEGLDLLRALCDGTVSDVHRLELLKSLKSHIFLDPEHQVVLESIRYLFSHGGVSMNRLTVHLNNRGFPEVDVEKYFRPSQKENE